MFKKPLVLPLFCLLFCIQLKATKVYEAGFVSSSVTTRLTIDADFSEFRYSVEVIRKTVFSLTTMTLNLSRF